MAEGTKVHRLRGRAAAWLMTLALSVTSFSYQAPPGGDPSAGEALFSGARPFEKGGPPCGACHTIGPLGFPNGGRMGPDLTREYSKLGEQGTDAALETLYFPSMLPLFDNRPLTPDEQRNLKAFFKQATSSGPPQNVTAILALVAFIGFLVLVALSWLLWRGRLGAVREPLVEAAGNRRS